jgi:tryptophan synthase beta chain
VLQDSDGQIMLTHSVSAGLDYAAVGPEHSLLRDQGRVSYASATDAEAMAGVDALCRLEGILPALESAHAVGWLLKQAKELPAGQLIVVNLSGRGDKDVQSMEKWDREHPRQGGAV